MGKNNIVARTHLIWKNKSQDDRLNWAQNAGSSDCPSLYSQSKRTGFGYPFVRFCREVGIANQTPNRHREPNSPGNTYRLLWSMVFSTIRYWLAALPFVFLCHSAWSSEIEKVYFKTGSSQLELTAYFARPNITPPYPAAVFLHGCSGIGISGSLSAKYSAWMRYLNSEGIAVLAIDSATPRGFGSTCGRSERRKTMYFQRPGDAYSGLQYLQSRPDIVPDKIALMGWSQGGGITLLSIATKSIGRPEPPPANDFAAAIAFYPSACSDRFQSKPFTEVEPGTWSTVSPLIVLQGARDNWTPSEPCEQFIQAARNRGEPVNIVVYPDAAHSFDTANLRLQRRSQPELADGSFPLIGTNKEARKNAFVRVLQFLRAILF